MTNLATHIKGKLSALLFIKNNKKGIKLNSCFEVEGVSYKIYEYDCSKFKNIQGIKLGLYSIGAISMLPIQSVFIEKFMLDVLTTRELIYVYCHEIGHIQDYMNNEFKLPYISTELNEVSADAFAQLALGISDTELLGIRNSIYKKINGKYN